MTSQIIKCKNILRCFIGIGGRVIDVTYLQW